MAHAFKIPSFSWLRRLAQGDTAAAGLSHPLWWLALGLLLLNDHALKGAGVLPGLVTGKLSDLAGLIVAPVLLVALLGARTHASRLACFGAVAAVFSAINLFPAAAQLTETLAATVGVPFRTWCDPTDLVALAALPVAWRLGRPRVALVRRRISPLERTAVVLGSVACMATGQPGPDPLSIQMPAAINDTAAVVDLRLRWIEADIDCDQVPTEVARALSPDLFGPGLTFRLQPGDAVSLEATAARASIGARSTGTMNPCDAVLMSAGGLDPTVAFWRAGFGVELLDPASPSPGEVHIGGDGTGLVLSATSGVVVAPAVAVPEPLSCGRVVPGVAPPATFGWSEPPGASGGRVTLAAVAVGADGCLALDLARGAGAPWRMYLCVPAAEFPFAPGDSLELFHTQVWARTLRLVRPAAPGLAARELAIISGDGGTSFSGWRGSRVDVTAECAQAGQRYACGAYALPARVTMYGLHTASAGETIDGAVDPATGRVVRVVIGRAERVIVAREGCGAGRDSVGDRVDLLISYREGA